jgi:hypothetical protein
MSRTFRAKYTALCLVVIAIAVMATAQEAPKPETVRFQFREVTEPADPELMRQDEEARTTSLRRSISRAITALEDEKFDQFFDQFIDPFWLARYAGAPGDKTVDSVLAFFKDNPDQMKGLTERYLKTLRSSLKQKPRWLLKGRAASFMVGRSSHSGEFWIYFDGKWRISPET